MKYRLLVFFFLLVFAVPVRGTIVDSLIKEDVLPEEFERLTAKAKQGRTHLAGTATGFFITSDGYFLTNYHVVKGSSEVVIVHKKKAYYATVVSKNSDKDISVLKINLFPKVKDGAYVSTKRPKVKALPLCKHFNVGESVYAIGFPESQILGYDYKITRGIISCATGPQGRKDWFQMDASITFGNSGSPVVDDYGAVVGIAQGGMLNGKGLNFAIRISEVDALLPKDAKVNYIVSRKKLGGDKLMKSVSEATALVLVYNEGACERISHTEVSVNNVKERELDVAIRKAKLDARMFKIKKDWESLRKVTDWVLETQGETEDMRQLNELARDELGLHLVIIADADGKEVEAKIEPISGFKNSEVRCGVPVHLYGGTLKKGFPVEAKLTYEDESWRWDGKLLMPYDWSGTKTQKVKLRRIEKKLTK